MEVASKHCETVHYTVHPYGQPDRKGVLKIVKFQSKLWNFNKMLLNFSQNCYILVKIVKSSHNCEIQLEL